MNQSDKPKQTLSLEQRIFNELCDVLDEPECYEDCVLGIHRTSHEVSVASPMSFNKDFEVFPLRDMFAVDEESGELDVDVDCVHDIVSRFERNF